MNGKEAAMKWICKQSASICDHPCVFSCTWIAKDIGYPVRKVRQWMKELSAEGFVRKSHEGGYDDWNDCIYCIHGYSLTKKGRELEYYKEKYQQEIEYWNESLSDTHEKEMIK